MPDSPGQVHSLPGLFIVSICPQKPQSARRGVYTPLARKKHEDGQKRRQRAAGKPRGAEDDRRPPEDAKKPQQSRQALPGLFRWFGRSPISQRGFLRPSEEFQELRFLSLLRFLEVLQRHRLRQDTSV